MPTYQPTRHFKWHLETTFENDNLKGYVKISWQSTISNGYSKMTKQKGSGQLVEWSLPIPEVHGSNPVIGKNLFILNICLLSTVY